MMEHRTSMQFPRLPCLLNGLVLWTVCLASREMWQLIRSGVVSIIVFKAVFASIATGFLVVLSFVLQIVLFSLFKNKIKNMFEWYVLFMLPSIAIGSMSIYFAVPSVKARVILSHAELANLPRSAHDIRVYTWSSPMSGEEFLKFKASSDDIEIFIASSPILKNKECEKYTQKKMRLPYPKNDGVEKEYLNTQHEYYIPDLSAPDWYDGEIKGNGRRYEIHPDGYHYPGELIIDDASSTISVKLIFS